MATECLVTFPVNISLSQVYSWCFIEEIYYSYVWKCEMDNATKWSYSADIVLLFKEAETKHKIQIKGIWKEGIKKNLRTHQRKRWHMAD